MDLHDNGLGKRLKDALKISSEEKNKISIQETIKQLINDPDYFVAYLLCAANMGSSRKTIQEVIGSKSTEVIQKFIDLDIIIEFNEKLHLKNKGIIVRDFNDYKHHLKTYSNFYNPSHVGRERNYCHSLTEGLNQEGIKELQKIHRNFHQKTKEIMRDHKFHGTIPIFSVAFCDSFTKINDEA